MLTIINLLCLVAMCAYVQTQNTLLFIVSVLYLSLSTLGCISIALSKSDSENMPQWHGWIPFILSLIVTGTVLYFTVHSPIGLWYLGITVFGHGITLSTKFQNNK